MNYAMMICFSIVDVDTYLGISSDDVQASRPSTERKIGGVSPLFLA